MRISYREMNAEEAESIALIDASCFIKNVWRRDSETGSYVLKRIDWTEPGLPNGYEWHLRRFQEALDNGGKAFGCYHGDTLAGYATVHGQVFGQQKYVLLDQMFVSRDHRGTGIGKALFTLCAEQARRIGAEKLYLCAASSEDTVAFYHALGCVPAIEPDPKLTEEDPRDIPLEFPLIRNT